METERIWYRDPLGLFSGDRVARFLPERNAPLVQQLNALFRFGVYFSCLMFCIGRRRLALITITLVAGATAALNQAAVADGHGGDRAPDGYTDGGTGRGSAHAGTCTRPTLDNPFGNVLLSDYTTRPGRRPACDIQDPAVASEVEALFDHNLYRDVGDALHRNANSRQFYTNPITTIPNDQDAFARWCYATGPGCKEGNGDRCATNTFRPVPGR